jgi:hypothetical protein
VNGPDTGRNGVLMSQKDNGQQVSSHSIHEPLLAASLVIRSLSADNLVPGHLQSERIIRKCFSSFKVLGIMIIVSNAILSFYNC